jgi:magnesium transporter
MDDVTDYFAPLIQKVEFESDAIEQLVMVLKKSEQQDMLVRIGLCRKLVMTLLKMLGTKVDVIKGLIKRFEDKLFVNESDKCGPGDVTLYLGDIQGKQE